MKLTYTEKAFVETEVDFHTRKPHREIWRNEEGQKHRGRDLPAVVTYDPETGEVMRKEYWFKGMQHRVDGPADEDINPENGVVTHEVWYRFDELLGGISRDPDTGSIIRSDFEDVAMIHKLETPDDFSPG